MTMRTILVLAVWGTVHAACSSGSTTGVSTPGTGGQGLRSGGAGMSGSGGRPGTGGTSLSSGGNPTGGAVMKTGGSVLGGEGGRLPDGGGAGGVAAGGAVSLPDAALGAEVADGRLPSTGGAQADAGEGDARRDGRATGGVGGTGAGGSDAASTGGASGVDAAGAVDTAATGPVRLEWTNPIAQKRADPHVFLHSDGYYYFTATVPEYDRIELRRATTLGGLSTATAQVVWRKHTSGEMGAHIWAPEIHFIDGAWYIYFTAGRTDDVWAIRMYVLKNTSANPLEGTWTELGRIKSNWDSFSLDATTFVHGGQRYYLWTQTVPDYPGTSIVISRMGSPSSLTGAQVVLSSPELTWEKQGHDVNEAPAALVKSGKVFITYSASATDQNYCMGLLTADETADLLDRKAWKKASQPVFKSNAATSQYGPGHNSFTTTPDGRVTILVYHTRNYRDIVGEPLNNPDRATRAQHLPFDSAGQPVFGVPVADGAYRVDVTP